MRLKNISLLLLIFILGITGCDDEPEKPQVGLPDSLTVQIESSANDPSIVNVTAKANAVNFFTITFLDGDNTESIETPYGTATHTYTKSGLYEIKVKAHALATNYIERTDTFRVYIEETKTEDGRPLNGYSSPMTYDGMTLVWNDEFDGEALNESVWNYELGTGSNGWGNNEQQYYLKENTIVADGYLSIEAKKQFFGNRQYTSSRLTTKNKKSFKYGRVDIRAALPEGQGIWPALWMLGNDISTVSWPNCGEIDIMELVGGTAEGKSDKTVHGTVHWDNAGSYASYGLSNSISTKFSEEFHVFSLIWDDEKIRILRDDKQYMVITTTNPNMSEFHQEFFFIFNVAVGGRWPGSPDSTTDFPQKMWVDYIRVFQ